MTGVSSWWKDPALCGPNTVYPSTSMQKSNCHLYNSLTPQLGAESWTRSALIFYCQTLTSPSRAEPPTLTSILLLRARTQQNPDPHRAPNRFINSLGLDTPPRRLTRRRKKLKSMLEGGKLTDSLGNENTIYNSFNSPQDILSPKSHFSQARPSLPFMFLCRPLLLSSPHGTTPVLNPLSRQRRSTQQFSKAPSRLCAWWFGFLWWLWHLPHWVLPLWGLSPVASYAIQLQWARTLLGRTQPLPRGEPHYCGRIFAVVKCYYS